jgi:hypothetical protein
MRADDEATVWCSIVTVVPRDDRRPRGRGRRYAEACRCSSKKCSCCCEMAASRDDALRRLPEKIEIMNRFRRGDL